MVSLAHCDLLDKPRFRSGVRLPSWPESQWQLHPKGEAFLGKLGLKSEPAGKIRVFAMVDA